MESVVLSVGYLGDVFHRHFGDGRDLGISVEYSSEATPAGTGGAIGLAAPHLAEVFFVLNGDTLFDIDFSALSSLVESGGYGAALALRHVDDAGRYGSVNLEGTRVFELCEKSRDGAGWINGGIYAMRKTVLTSFPPPPCSIEREVFPRMCADRNLGGIAFDGFFIDIGLPSTLQQSQTALPEWLATKNAPESKR